MGNNTHKKEKNTSEKSIKDIPLLVPTKLKAIHEPTGEEFELEFAKRVDYDENGNKPIIYYRTIP